MGTAEKFYRAYREAQAGHNISDAEFEATRSRVELSWIESALMHVEIEPSVSTAITAIAKYGEQFIFGDGTSTSYTFNRAFDSGNRFTVKVEREQ